ncbi:MAG TPA: aconitate hydratase AcnA [Anaerolineaceae bacterium]|nr:aconitate hydratase AcnA [Anaerolineaceae bacterium]
MTNLDLKSLLRTLSIQEKTYQYYSLPALKTLGFKNVEKMPYCLRILLEGMIRNYTQKGFSGAAILNLMDKNTSVKKTILFSPSRVLLQDFTGIPVLNDMTALRAAIARKEMDPRKVNPVIRTDLVVDHSLQVDYAGCAHSQELNEKKEFERNQERYQFLHWGEQAFDNLNIIPPGNGIVHQLNLEYLADVVTVSQQGGNLLLQPDSVLGTDSHTPMINGLGVVGWGVGGIEALAAMLGYPIEFTTPPVVGLHLTGRLPEDVTPTDLTLTITSSLRAHGVVGKFVEVYGEGVNALRLEDRAMIANMTPESGATITYFPVDERTLEYLRLTGRAAEKITLVEAYFKAQDLFRTINSADPLYDELIEIDLSTVRPVVAGPKRPFDLVQIEDLDTTFTTSLQNPPGNTGFGLPQQDTQKTFPVKMDSQEYSLKHGAVILAAITSCTNTSNPVVLLGAGLLAKKAVERGLKVPPYVKTSFTPGSQVVDKYLNQSGLLPFLAKLGFEVSGHGCATCIGNSGPLPPAIDLAVKQGLVGSAVISGNRNFEGRIHKSVKACYLASPLLVIAYAIAGTMNIDLQNSPLGIGEDGNPVYLRDVWPAPQEVRQYLQFIHGELYRKVYENGMHGNEQWQSLSANNEDVFSWDANSSYLREPPFIQDYFDTLQDIQGARVLALLGDSITTDHISPAGNIQAESDSGVYLQTLGVVAGDLNTYGARRGNHEAMLRGTFANPRLLNKLVGRKAGGFTNHFPDGKEMSIYQASCLYKNENIPLIVIAGKQYGTGSSRDWAAKGPFLLGVRAVLAESYERIHRSNLVMMGILPLQFREGENAVSVGIDGSEKFSITGIEQAIRSGQSVTVCMRKADGSEITFQAIPRVDTPMEYRYFTAGGILPAIFRDVREQE